MSRAVARLTCAVLVAAFMVASTGGRAWAGEHLRSQVHEHLWYYWPTRYIYYYIQSTGGSGLNVGPGSPLDAEAITEAAHAGFDAWQDQPCTDLRFFYAGIVTDRASNMTEDTVNDKNTIIFRGSDWDDTDCLDAIACTTVVTRRSAGEIIDADIDLNAGDGGFQFVVEPIQGSAAFDIQSVLTHEIGHMIGFNHSENPDAVMWPYAEWGEQATRRALFQDDIDLLCLTYAAGECTTINDYLQQFCPDTEIQGTCSVAAPAKPGPPTERRSDLTLGLPLVGLGAGLFLVRRARRRFRPR